MTYTHLPNENRLPITDGPGNGYFGPPLDAPTMDLDTWESVVVRQDVVYIRKMARTSGFANVALVAKEQEPTPPVKGYRSLLKLAGAAIAVVTAFAGLIQNVEAILDFFQPSVSGQWILTQTVDPSMSTSFLVTLNQHGHGLSGDAVRIHPDGKPVTAAEQGGMTLRGQISGKDVMLEYTERDRGSKTSEREIIGSCSLKLVRAGFLGRRISGMEGTFSATGSSSSGKAVAVPRTK